MKAGRIYMPSLRRICGQVAGSVSWENRQTGAGKLSQLERVQVKLVYIVEKEVVQKNDLWLLMIAAPKGMIPLSMMMIVQPDARA